MKKLSLIIFLFFSVCCFAQIDKVIPARPNPPKLVNDLANVLTIEQVDALERKLVAYDVDFDHKNGDRSNNKLSNCQVLCVPCHRRKHA